MAKQQFWSALILTLVVIGILFMLYYVLSASQISLNIGVMVFSSAAIMIGIEAIIKKKIILRSQHDRRLSESYTGKAATAQGLIIISTGFFLIALIIINSLNVGKSLFQHFIQHPGIPLILISINIFLTSIFIGAGSLEDKQGLKGTRLINLITSRLLPSLILIIIAAAAMVLGVIEVLEPVYFDSIGGGLLEIIFLGQK